MCFFPQIRIEWCFYLLYNIYFLLTSSSSSDDSRISDLDEDPNLVINNSKSRSSPGELPPGRSLKNNSRTIGSGTKSLSITEKIKSTNKKKDLSSDADSDFKSGKDKSPVILFHEITLQYS